jgi:hypothetical protein
MVIVAEPVQAMLIKIWGYVPTIVGALLILVIGWLVAKVIETVAVRVLKAIRVDMASDKAGLTNILAQGDIKVTVSELLGGIVYWLLMLVVIATVLNALNLTVAASILSRFVEYIPNILAAVFILVLGMFLASFTAAIVRTAASNAGVENSKALAEISKTILIVFAILIAIEQLGIGVAVINLAISIILASIGLAVGLAFGLGSKDIAGKMLADMLNKMKK